ncbi:ABC transporter permease [Listeria cornellensis]|nr:ABC transporter permease [Listeria cornellensis]
MKKTAGTLTMIAVLSATTLTIIGALSSFYTNIISFAETSNPNSYQTNWSTQTERAKILEAIRESKSNTLVYHDAVDIYNGDVIDKVDESIPYVDQRMTQFSVMALSDYNRLAMKLDNDSQQIKQLDDGEAIFLSPNGRFENKKRAHLWMKDPYTVTFKNNPMKYSLKIKAIYNHVVFNTDMVFSTLVVNDRLYQEISRKTMPRHIDIFQVTNEDRAEALDHKIQKIVVSDPYFYFYSGRLSSFYSNYHMMSTLIGVMLYIGMFMGIVFFAATGSIIYFKQITEAVDERPRFDVLQKLGMSQKEVRAVIAKQVLPVFLIPLILGICHSVAAMIGLSVNLLYSVGAPVMISTTIYTVFFIVYYFVCVNTYTKMVANGDD